MADKPPLPSPINLGAFFAPQYYGLLCNEPNNMHHFYTELSTMILAINNDTINTATDLDEIHNLLMSLNFLTIEIKSANSRQCWGCGVLLVVTGSVKIKDVSGFRNFVHTMYLASKANGYFVLNDILHIINLNLVINLSNPVIQLSAQQIDPRFHSQHPPPVTDNGHLSEAVVKKINELMTRMVNDIERPPPKLQQRRLSREWNDIQLPPFETSPSAQDGGSSSGVGNGCDTIHENVVAFKIQEDEELQLQQEMLEQEEDPSQISYRSILISPPATPAPSPRGRGRGNNTRGHSSGDRNGGKGKSKK